jgi:hypothetical protein
MPMIVQGPGTSSWKRALSLPLGFVGGAAEEVRKGKKRKKGKEGGREVGLKRLMQSSTAAKLMGGRN